MNLVKIPEGLPLVSQRCHFCASVNMSVHSGDAPCFQCRDTVNDDSQAMCCDQWTHINCVNITEEAYELHQSMLGLPWMCSCCKLALKAHMKDMELLKAENLTLRLQVSELKETCNALNYLQVDLQKVQDDLNFLTQEENSTTSVMTQAHPSVYPFTLIRTAS